ncbi:MAG: hypothetical protein Q7Q71_16050 [Verrucomicrobiota bacterium JB023]|nr:hypothetical protein [Verrucomicrobiota bacterium JB023]
MDTLWEILQHPATWGFAAGLVLTFFTWKSSLGAKRELRRENKRLNGELRDLQNHLNTQLKINASGNDSIQKKVDELKEQNETLRVNLAALQNKPGRNEMRQLHTMESAVRLMREQAPGFASAWEQAVRQAEAEYEESAKGLKKLVRRVISLPGPSENSDEKDSDKD